MASCIGERGVGAKRWHPSSTTTQAPSYRQITITLRFLSVCVFPRSLTSFRGPFRKSLQKAAHQHCLIHLHALRVPDSPSLK